MDPTAGFQPGLQLQLRDCLVQTDPELYALLSCVAVFCLRLSLTPSLLQAVLVCVCGGGGKQNQLQILPRMGGTEGCLHGTPRLAPARGDHRLVWAAHRYGGAPRDTRTARGLGAGWTPSSTP